MDNFTIKDHVDNQLAIISLSSELSFQEQPAHFELSSFFLETITVA